METRFATYFVQISNTVGIRVAPAENCERRVLIVANSAVFLSSSSSANPRDLAAPDIGYLAQVNIPISIVLRANQGLYAFGGDGGNTQLGVSISDHPMGCMP